MNKHLLNLEQWNRKEHFEFYRKFSEPFFGLCVDLDCTAAYDKSKENGDSFFLYYLHKSIVAANEIEPFRYRIQGDAVEVYDHVRPAPTVGREDGTFGFAIMEYKKDFAEFQSLAKAEIERVRKGQGLMLSEGTEAPNTIHYSAIPWVRFTAFSHARSFDWPDSHPKISFGKIWEQGKKRFMPVSIHVHHALLDGFHVGQYVDLFQQMLND